ncbi:disabled homolog 2-interacting protein-like isoform X1 [Lates japonicus]|uniref:Disabled homolog 2-interacting protein-like isoform X1 n=1 Tax=Lates japonicus TaxID=270547 RepID=A0AAD3N993_LATJO|nr:disabled homolog 2-interacting protein-like isoform X1 [Lates japonicus]
MSPVGLPVAAARRTEPHTPGFGGYNLGRELSICTLLTRASTSCVPMEARSSPRILRRRVVALANRGWLIVSSPEPQRVVPPLTTQCPPSPLYL